MGADVLVVGAGIAGLATAWHLGGRARVLVVEQGDAPAAEATAQNAGMIRRMGEDPFERALAIRTFEWLEDPGDDWAEPPSRAVGAVLALGHDPLHLRDAVAHLRARGARVERCDRPHEIAPVLAGSALRAAWWVPGERIARADQLAAGFLRGIRRREGQVRCGVRVTSLAVEGGRVVGVDTDRGRIGAGAVVLAAGAWCGRLAASVGLRRPLLPLRRTVFRTAPSPLATERAPWVWIDDVGAYARPEAEGFLVSGCDEALDPPGDGPGSTGVPTGAQRAWTAAKVARWFPALAGAELGSGWSGLRTFAPDRRPLLGADPELPGLWWCAGLGGYGISGGYAAGEAVAAWLTGGEVPWLRPGPVSPGRPHLSRAPIRPEGDLGSAVLVDVGTR